MLLRGFRGITEPQGKPDSICCRGCAATTENSSWQAFLQRYDCLWALICKTVLLLFYQKLAHCLHLLQGLLNLAVLPSALPLILPSCPFLSFFNSTTSHKSVHHLTSAPEAKYRVRMRTLMPLLVIFVSHER